MTTTSTTIGAARPKTSSTPSLLRDQLSQFDGPQKPAGDFIAASRAVIAWLCSLCGMGIGVWVVYVIHTALYRPEKLGLPLRILKAEDLTIVVPNGKIEIPPAAAQVVGYLLAVFLLAIATRIAVGMIGSGTGLLRGPKDTDKPTAA